MKENFKVVFLEEALLFLHTIDEKAREKIIYNIRKAQITNDPELFKKLNDEIWEFRTLYNKTAYRLFAFWDRIEGAKTIVVSTHGIIKKTDKTPIAAIGKALQLKKIYLNQKSPQK